MNSGLMDTQIRIETPVYVDSAYGKATKANSWTTVKTIWGRVAYNGGGESISGDKKEFRENVTLTFHYIDASSLTLTQRLYFQSKYWNVTSKAILGRNQYIRVEADSVE